MPMFWEEVPQVISLSPTLVKGITSHFIKEILYINYIQGGGGTSTPLQPYADNNSGANNNILLLRAQEGQPAHKMCVNPFYSVSHGATLTDETDRLAKRSFAPDRRGKDIGGALTAATSHTCICNIYMPKKKVPPATHTPANLDGDEVNVASRSLVARSQWDKVRNKNNIIIHVFQPTRTKHTSDNLDGDEVNIASRSLVAQEPIGQGNVDVVVQPLQPTQQPAITISQTLL